MWNIVFWLYFINLVFLINHEIDAAYWHEWNLFRAWLRMAEKPHEKQRDMSVFLLLHFPFLILVLYGLISVYKHLFAGLMLSLFLSFGGIFAFVAHKYFIYKGRKEFTPAISQFILFCIFVISIIQGLATIYLII